MWSATPILFIFALFGGFCHVSSGPSYSRAPETVSSNRDPFLVTLFLWKFASAYNQPTGDLSIFFEDSFNATDCNKTIQKDEFLKKLLKYRKNDSHRPVNTIGILSSRMPGRVIIKNDWETVTYRIKDKSTTAETEFVLNTHDLKLISAKSLNC